jgi:hypothetical protein
VVPSMRARKNIRLYFDCSNASVTPPGWFAVPSPLPDIGDNVVPKLGTVMPDDALRVAAHASEPPIGAVMKDGTIYAGISPDTCNPMYTTSADVALTMTFNEAADHAQDLNAQKLRGHDDWRLPTKAELNVLFNNRSAIGGFDISDSLPTGWYWSSSQFNRWDAWGQNFVNGAKDNYPKYHLLSVRCVR